ncbi:MAG: toxin-antitoxin system protein [Clostridiales bacterium]|nr:toxin-antitoxin system protein [Clostridiales bacterium]
MKPLKSKISVTLDNNVIATIRQLAELDDRSFSQYVNLVLKRHLQCIEASEKKQVAI